MTAKNFEDFFASGGTTADLLYDLGRGYCVVERATLDAEWRAYKGDSPPAATAALAWTGGWRASFSRLAYTRHALESASVGFACLLLPKLGAALVA